MDPTLGGTLASLLTSTIGTFVAKGAMGDLGKPSQDRKLHGWKAFLASVGLGIVGSAVQGWQSGLPWKQAMINAAVGVIGGQAGYLASKHS